MNILRFFYQRAEGCISRSDVVLAASEACRQISKCSSVSVNSDPGSKNSYIIFEKLGDVQIGLELINLAATGALPISYIDKYNGYVCLEAKSEKFIDAAADFGLGSPGDRWIQRSGSCSQVMREFSADPWPVRQARPF